MGLFKNWVLGTATASAALTLFVSEHTSKQNVADAFAQNRQTAAELFSLAAQASTSKPTDKIISLSDPAIRAAHECMRINNRDASMGPVVMTRDGQIFQTLVPNNLTADNFALCLKDKAHDDQKYWTAESGDFDKNLENSFSAFMGGAFLGVLGALAHVSIRDRARSRKQAAIPTPI